MIVNNNNNVVIRERGDVLSDRSQLSILQASKWNEILWEEHPPVFSQWSLPRVEHTNTHWEKHTWLALLP